jgi:hypothetical protein
MPSQKRRCFNNWDGYKSFFLGRIAWWTAYYAQTTLSALVDA